KMWYSPLNTGAGYAMGVRAGAEMTTFEMRFIALRIKGTIAPTGTIAQGVHMPHINRYGEEYLSKYGEATTINRLKATITEERIGNGPCSLDTRRLTGDKESELMKAYLNMAPVQTLAWIDKNQMPSKEAVIICGTEPYIVGGHGAAGYWVDNSRQTTLKGLYAIGDVAGGSPKKYVTGCFAEAAIASKKILESIDKEVLIKLPRDIIKKILENSRDRFIESRTSKTLHAIESLELEMQEIMDRYAGGISTFYEYTIHSLNKAEVGIKKLIIQCENLKASNGREFVLIHELKDRLWVAQTVITHLGVRKETRWNCYQENIDYPLKDDENYFKYINSSYRDGKFNVIYRKIIKKDEVYEHSY
ncbi:MAG: FAD-binding protein, partial [Acidaminobacteraceae bacterium]